MTPCERMGRGVPAIEVTNDRHARRVRRPDGEMHTRHATDLADVRAELLVRAVVRPLREEVKVVVGEKELVPWIHYIHPS